MTGLPADSVSSGESFLLSVTSFKASASVGTGSLVCGFRAAKGTLIVFQASHREEKSKAQARQAVGFALAGAAAGVVSRAEEAN